MVDRKLFFACLGLFIASVAAPAVADGPAALDNTLDLELAGAPASAVLESMASVLEAELVLDPAVTGEVTIELHRVSLRTALDAVCDMLGCDWKLAANRLVVTARAAEPEGPAEERGDLDTRLTLSLEDAEVREVLASFAHVGGWKLELGRPRVTLELRDAPLREALDRVCALTGCVWSLDEEGDQGVLRFDWLD